MSDTYLEPGEFELDDYVFGLKRSGCVVLTEGWDAGKVGVRHQDAPAPRRHAMNVGRDYRTPPVWTFDLLFLPTQTHTVREQLARARAVWRSPRWETMGETTTLRFRQHDITSMVVCRPREFAVEPQPVSDDSYALATATVQLTQALMFADRETPVVLGSVITDQQGGIVLPERLPWNMSPSTTRSGDIQLPPSAAPSPVRIVFIGPTTGESLMTVTDGTWMVEPVNPVKAGHSVVVDAMTGTSVDVASGEYVPLSLRSTLNATIRGGTTTLQLFSSDASNTARAVLTFRAAEYL